MGVFVINDAVITAVEEVVAHADANRFSLHEVMRMMNRRELAPGNFPPFVVVIPIRTRCVYTIEQQPCGWCRHLSVSLMSRTALPSKIVVTELLKLFGFKKTWEELAKVGLVTAYPPTPEEWAFLSIHELL